MSPESLVKACDLDKLQALALTGDGCGGTRGPQAARQDQGGHLFTRKDYDAMLMHEIY